MSKQEVPGPVAERNPAMHLDAANERKVKLGLAMNSAMLEILKENRPELIRRARVKLKAMGVEVSDEELAGQ